MASGKSGCAPYIVIYLIVFFGVGYLMENFFTADTPYILYFIGYLIPIGGFFYMIYLWGKNK